MPCRPTTAACTTATACSKRCASVRAPCDSSKPTWRVWRTAASGCGIPFAAMPQLRADISAAAKLAPPEAVLKIIVTRGSASAADTHRTAAKRRGECCRCGRRCRCPPRSTTVCALHVAAIRLADNPALAGIKHLNRLENVLAAQEAAADGAFDALMLDARGRVISGTMCNCSLARAGTLATPRVDLLRRGGRHARRRDARVRGRTG